MNRDHIPAGSHTLTPYFLVSDLGAYVEFLKEGFGATVVESLKKDDGSLMHAEMQIGDSRLMLGGKGDSGAAQKCMQYVYVPDTDVAFAKLIGAGCVEVQKPEDQFYGHRTAAVRDPEHNEWWLATPTEKLSHEEMQKRALKARPS